jgi:hypothetical protein
VVTEATVFVLVFGGLLVLRVVLATVFFALILPRGDRCPNCDAVTLRLASVMFDRVMPWFRRSWCLTCGWRGVLRRGPASEEPARIEVTASR